jgi:hypothetical protein
MTTATANVSKPDDFLILDKYINPNDAEVEGNFPIFVRGVSVCCKNNTGEIVPFPVIIPRI